MHSNLPEDLQLMAEALIHSATKHGFAFVGALFKYEKDDAAIAVVRNTNDENPAEVFKVIGELVGLKITQGCTVEVKVARPS